MQNGKWWGAISVPQNNSYLLSGSTFMLAIEHKAKEWCVHAKINKTKDVQINENEFEEITGAFSPINCGDISRYIVETNTNNIDIKPSLPNRTVVCRPKSPITLLPGASVVIYLSIPIWISVGVMGKEHTLLKELPTQKLSDTWFGASTREGELCYASQTIGRLDIDKLPFRLQRSVTPLLIENKAHNDLVFERIALPVPSLSLFTTETGQLWTQNVTLTREGDGDFAKLKLGLPQSNLTFISGPRVDLGHGQLFRAFSAIFN